MRAEDIVSIHEAEDARVHVEALLEAMGQASRRDLVELGALVVAAYPALAAAIDAAPEDLVGLGQHPEQARDLHAYRALGWTAVGDVSDLGRVRKGLRRFASGERLRIAARELLAYPGQDVDVTARELSDLADVCCEIALAEALAWAEVRFGAPLTASGAPCGLTVIGMGKLGGDELNAGSDIDLILFYETDDGFVRPAAATDSADATDAPDETDARATRDEDGIGGARGDDGAHTLHEHFTRVAQRFIATLDEATEDGVAWRVDMRLRPEGTRGPLVNALAAAERYYESWGRTWERAALVRARPVAGDVGFGARLLETLAPFVWRRAVDPRLAAEIASLLTRARIEAGPDVARDLKLGPGGIREIEFFAQALQLIWGGREPRVRGPNTIDALRRLHAHGFVTERERRELADAYLFLRRLEHRVQFATGQQTHAVPRDPDLVARIARSLGYDGPQTFATELEAVRGRVASRFTALLQDRPREERDPVLDRLWAAIDAQDEPAVAGAAADRFGPAAGSDLPRHLLALARPPDAPLGVAARDRAPDAAGRIVTMLADAADPEQATRLLAAFFARLATPGGYSRALAEDPRFARALCSLLGASAFLGDALVLHPDLVDRVVFGRRVPTPEAARAQVAEELSTLVDAPPDDIDALVGALRRAKRRVTFEVGLADLAGELETRDVGHALSALADAILQQACRRALREAGAGEDRGLAVVGMGKLGGREIGYGSDLDLLFVYEADDEGAPERFARVAQRVLRLLETPHSEGAGYALDTRLRPSGSHGLLVVSVEGFARYQETHAQSWERQALVKARACAGDPQLGARVIAIARAAAYERGAPEPDRMHHLRTRMQNELGHERLDRSPARYDLKVGRGGIVDVEFAAQWLQMKHGGDPRVRTTETEVALTALETCGYVDRTLGATLRQGWRFLRRLEQRLRIAHGTSASLLEEGAPGLVPLARRMGMRDGPRAGAERVLLERYVSMSTEIRAAYLHVLGLEGR